MVEFQNWISSDLHLGSPERILWIVGAPGVGKSTLGAYFLELVRCLDREAVLVYFFLRNGVSGLNKASDVVRTFAYRFATMIPEVRLSLEKLKKSGFKPDDGVGLHLLISKLLLEPLLQSKRPAYIILDGLDEADNSLDSVDLRRQSIEILVDSLCRLPSTRLLFLCRPSKIVRKILRCVDSSDNKEDIKAYVHQRLAEHKALQARFAQEEIEPCEFFLHNSNGIFLWVVLVLDQLSETESRSAFRKYVHDMSRTPSDMTRLYLNIVERLTPEQRKWIREILYWIVAPKRQLAIDELQNAVEWCLEDELNNFREYVEFRCGSIFRMSKIDETTNSVQIIHETLRSFLADSKSCPADLYVTADVAHEHLTVACLTFLSTDGTDSQPLHHYATTAWNYHLMHTKARKDKSRILSSLYCFFHSANFKNWVNRELVQRWRSGAILHIEERVLGDVQAWLSMYPDSGSDPKSGDSEDLKLAIKWMQSMVLEPHKLGEYIGKAAASIWLFDELRTVQRIDAAFRLTMRYYGRRNGGRGFISRDELEQLLKTNFAPLLSWSGSPTQAKLRESNLQIAYSTLAHWDERLAFRTALTYKTTQEIWEDIQLSAARNLKSSSVASISTNLDRSKSWASTILKPSHTVNKIAAKAIEKSKLMVQHDPTDYVAWLQLADAHRAINQYHEAIQAYKSAIEIKPRDLEAYGTLAEVYRLMGRHDSAIETFEMAIRQHPDAESWSALGWAFRASRNEDKAVECFQRSVEINPAFAAGWRALVDIYIVKGDFDKAIEVTKNDSAMNPSSSNPSSCLGKIYQAQGKAEEAIKSYEDAVKRDSAGTWAKVCLADAYRCDQRYLEAIASFWTVIEQGGQDAWAWKGLAESYRAINETNRAVAVYMKAVELLPVDYSLYISVGKIFTEMGKYELATNCFRAAIEQCPNNGSLLYAFLSLPTSPLLSNYPVISLNDDITSSLVWSYVALALRQAGDIVGETKLYDEIINQYTEAINQGSENRLLWIYSSYNGSQGFDPFAKRLSLPAEILWTLLGEAYKEKGDYENAINSYEHALDVLPSNKWLWMTLSNIHEMRGDQQKANECRITMWKVDEEYSQSFYSY